MTSSVDDGCYWRWTKWPLVVCLILDIGWAWSMLVQVAGDSMEFEGIPAYSTDVNILRDRLTIILAILAHNE